MRTITIVWNYVAISYTIFTAALLLVWMNEARAGDYERGQLLYENHCTVCHESTIHIRDNRKATSREEIQAWAKRWQKELGLQWTTSDVDDVIEYLDKRYYKLKSKS